MLETGDFGGDELGGLEFEVFRARKRISEHCEHLEQVFRGKTSFLIRVLIKAPYKAPYNSFLENQSFLL